MLPANTRRPTAPHHPRTARINTAHLFIDPIRPARPFMCSLPLPRFPFPTPTYAIQMKQMNHNTTQIISRARRSHHTSASARPHMLSQTESACSKCASHYNTHACIYIPPHHSDTRPLAHPSIHPSIHCLTPITIHIARTNRYAPTPVHAHPHIYTHIAHKLIDTRPRSIHPRTAQINTAHVFHRPASMRPLIRSYMLEHASHHTLHLHAHSNERARHT